jgi:hypothetical protein
MKNNIFYSLITGVLLSCSSNETLQVGNKTSIQIEPEFNAGNIMLGEEIESVFHIKNTGKYPLLLSDVKGSCSCTVVDFPDEPLAPGKSEEITARVETKNASVGQLIKEIRIVANTDPSLTLVKVKANVYRK